MGNLRFLGAYRALFIALFIAWIGPIHASPKKPLIIRAASSCVAGYQKLGRAAGKLKNFDQLRAEADRLRLESFPLSQDYPRFEDARNQQMESMAENLNWLESKGIFKADSNKLKGKLINSITQREDGNHEIVAGRVVGVHETNDGIFVKLLRPDGGYATHRLRSLEKIHYLDPNLKTLPAKIAYGIKTKLLEMAVKIKDWQRDIWVDEGPLRWTLRTRENTADSDLVNRSWGLLNEDVLPSHIALRAVYLPTHPIRSISWLVNRIGSGRNYRPGQTFRYITPLHFLTYNVYRRGFNGGVIPPLTSLARNLNDKGVAVTDGMVAKLDDGEMIFSGKKDLSQKLSEEEKSKVQKFREKLVGSIENSLEGNEEKLHRMMGNKDISQALDYLSYQALLSADKANQIALNLSRRILQDLSENQRSLIEQLGQYFVRTGNTLFHRQRSFLSQQLETNLLTDLVVGYFVFNYVYGKVDRANDKLVVEKTKPLVEEREDRWLAEIPRDPFLNRVRYKLERGEITSQEASVEAYLRLHALDAYYFYRNEREDEDNYQDLAQKVLSDPHISVIFPASKQLAEKGPTQSKGIELPSDSTQMGSTPATLSQQGKLIELNEEYFKKRSLIKGLIFNPKLLSYLLEDPDHRQLWQDLATNPYAKNYFNLFSKGEIDQDRLHFLLLEIAQIEEKFSRWALFGAKRYVTDENGKRRYLDANDFLDYRAQHVHENSQEINDFMAVDFFDHNEFNNTHLMDRPWEGEISNLAMLRFVMPSARRVLMSYNRYVRRFAKGQAKGRAKGSGGVNYKAIVDDAGQIRVNPVSRGVGYRVKSALGSGVVAFDLGLRSVQLLTLEETIDATNSYQYFDILPEGTKSELEFEGKSSAKEAASREEILPIVGIDPPKED